MFADHFSHFTYVHLLTILDAESTVEAKQCFKCFSMDHGVTVRHYHVDNCFLIPNHSNNPYSVPIRH